MNSLQSLKNQRPEWFRHALCAQVDTDLFFPEKGGSARPAKRLCGMCPVQTDCLSYAMAHNERFGIYGGLTAHERDRIRRQDSALTGSSFNAAKLSFAIVAEARTRHAAGESQRGLAAEYGVSQSTMRAAISGQTWAKVAS